MIAPVLHVLPLTTISRQRVLPVDGRVMVKPGQKVTPSDVIAEGVSNRKHAIVDLVEHFGVLGPKIDKLIKVKRGQRVAKNEVLAVFEGVFSKEVRSPAEGRVVLAGSGKIVIEAGGAAIQIRAGMNGTITEIIGDRGAIIRGSGSLVQGVWGNGKSETGILLNLLTKPDAILDPGSLDVSLRGSVILGGHVMDRKVLTNGAEAQVRGLILTSLSPSLLGAAMQAPYPIIVLEGFIRQSLNSVAFKLLSTNVKREVCLSAVLPDRFQMAQPEVFIPLPVAQEPPEPQDVEALAPGLTVRFSSLLQPSRLGTITEILPGLSTMPNGMKVPAADVRLETGEQVLAPLSNLEVVG